MMRERLESLSQRERLMLLGLAALIGIAIILFGVVGPVFDMRDRARGAYVRAERIAASTRNLTPQGADNQDDRALRSVVIAGADAASVNYTRINQTTDGIQLDIADTPYAAFYRWLDRLEDENGVVVAEAYVTKGDKPGTLEARVTLTREG